jgi:hypothetical protein
MENLISCSQEAENPDYSSLLVRCREKDPAITSVASPPIIQSEPNQEQM